MHMVAARATRHAGGPSRRGTSRSTHVPARCGAGKARLLCHICKMWARTDAAHLSWRQLAALPASEHSGACRLEKTRPHVRASDREMTGASSAGRRLHATPRQRATPAWMLRAAQFWTGGARGRLEVAVQSELEVLRWRTGARPRVCERRQRPRAHTETENTPACVLDPTPSCSELHRGAADASC